MKKCLLTFVAVCLAVMIAVPAMALDTKFSGEYRIRGWHNDNPSLSSNDSSSSYMDMRFRLRTDFIISDHLTLSTRFDALDNKLFGTNTERDREDVNFERAWMTIRTDIGTFMGGRMSGGAWGTLFNDTEGERDRLRWHDTFGDLTLYVLYDKNAEGDRGNEVSDQDNDVYSLGAFYKMENISTGLLYSYGRNRSNPTVEIESHSFNPFVIGQFGPFGFQGEARYITGDVDRDTVEGDADVEQYAYNLEATYSMDMFKFELGYAFTRGQSRSRDIEGYSGIGEDWQKVWILTNSEDRDRNLLGGGQGNLSGSLAAETGANIYYGGVSMTPFENLDVKLLVAYAEADKTSVAERRLGRNVSDEFGWEYDLFVDYKIFDNLTYSFIAAYLDAGDYWRDTNIDGGSKKDNFHLFHQLRMSF